MEDTITAKMGRREASAVLLTQLFETPAVSIKQVQAICGLSKKAAGDLVDVFVENEILGEITGNTRNRIFLFDGTSNSFIKKSPIS